MNFLRHLIFILLCWHSLPLHASEQQTIDIAVGKAMKPFVLGNGRGILIDILRESFAQSSIQIKFHFYSNEEAMSAFDEGRVDAVTVVKKGMVQGHFSEPYITFHNYAIFMKDGSKVIEKVADLANYRVIGFSGATRYLGPEFNQLVLSGLDYVEIVSQFDQVRALFEGQAEVAVMEKTIFQFFWKQLRNRNPDDIRYARPVSYSNLFIPNDYHIAFKTQKEKEIFNKGYRHLVDSGRIKLIYERYTRLLRTY